MKARRLSAAKQQLTRREKEILRFLALGKGTSTIARELSISRATVRNHAQRILAKLQVHSRLAAVARGCAMGLVVVPGSPAQAAPEIVDG
jgi:DNA-binding NarL/FixJ family response regulator